MADDEKDEKKQKKDEIESESHEFKVNNMESKDFNAALKQLTDDMLSDDINLSNKYDKELILSLLKRAKKEAKKDIAKSHTKWSPDYSNLIKLNTVEEVQKLIKENQNSGKVIRCAGSQHSVPSAVFGTNRNDDNIIHIKLEKELREVKLIEKIESKEDDKKYALIRVGCGCNLGIDPSDPESNEDNSFNRIIDKWGYALPITGGMSHQTLGGFLSTSSHGGTIKYSFGECVEVIEWVDGNGDIQIAKKGEDVFYAVGVSMGLYGILTHLTIKCQSTYLVKGVEETVEFADSFLKDGNTYSKAYNDDEYVHSVWFPQPDVHRVLQFKANQVSPDNKIKKYHHPLQKHWKDYAAAVILFLINVLQKKDEPTWQQKFTATLLNEVIMPLGKEDFCDHWYIALPNDDQALIDTVIRVQFTEIWIEFNQVQNVLDVLHELFKTDATAGGNFGVEMYAAKASSFWLSQGYGCNHIRVDPYWWEYNIEGNINEYFSKFWNALFNSDKIKTLPRLHVGKHFPAVGTKYDKFVIGPEYFNAVYPKFKEWMELRDKYDPKQIFVTNYWRDLLGIPKKQQ